MYRQVMSISHTIHGTARALDEAQAKGAHTVRVHVDVLETLLNASTLLALALKKVDEREANNAG